MKKVFCDRCDEEIGVPYSRSILRELGEWTVEIKPTGAFVDLCTTCLVSIASVGDTPLRNEVTGR